jgi:hypothetical protein
MRRHPQGDLRDQGKLCKLLFRKRKQCTTLFTNFCAEATIAGSETESSLLFHGGGIDIINRNKYFIIFQE